MNHVPPARRPPSPLYEPLPLPLDSLLPSLPPATSSYPPFFASPLTLSSFCSPTTSTILPLRLPLTLPTLPPPHSLAQFPPHCSFSPSSLPLSPPACRSSTLPIPRATIHLFNLLRHPRSLSSPSSYSITPFLSLYLASSPSFFSASPNLPPYSCHPQPLSSIPHLSSYLPPFLALPSGLPCSILHKPVQSRSRYTAHPDTLPPRLPCHTTLAWSAASSHDTQRPDARLVFPA